MYIKHIHTHNTDKWKKILYQAISQKDKKIPVYTVYKQCKKSSSDRCPIHVFQLCTVCTGRTGLRLTSAWTSEMRWNRRHEGLWGAEGKGRGGMLIRERWRDRNYCALLYSTWLEKRSTPSILNPPVLHTNTQTAHREQQIDTFFLIKGKGSGLCAMPAHSKH